MTDNTPRAQAAPNQDKPANHPWDPDSPHIQAAVAEWMSRPEFLKAHPASFWDDVCSEGVDRRDSEPAVYAAIERILGSASLKYQFARHESYGRMRGPQ